jgi:aldehyde:ferredoxin oxidoreductase
MIAAMSFTITFSNLGMAARDWKGTLLGKVLGQGALTAARVLGVRRVSSVKGQGMPAYDPRAIKGNGVTYATSPMGADHTAGNVIPGRTGFHFDNKRTDMDVTDQGGKLKLSRDLQIMTTVCDSLGFCFFVGATLSNLDVFAKLINARFGIDFTAIDLLEMGLATIKREILFNERAGISFAANDLPEFFRIEKLPPKGYAFEIEKEGLVTLFS